MLPYPLRSALSAAQYVALVTLLRSVAFDRWFTVTIAAILLGGAFAAQRGRTWGLALALTAAVAFPVAWAIGIAPPWFVVVGVAGIRPFIDAYPSLARFDRKAAALLAGVATAFGAAAAVAWKYSALAVFASFPVLRSSLHPHHGWAVLTILAVAVAVRLSLRKTPAEREEEARFRIAENVADGAATGPCLAEASALADEMEEEPAARPALAARSPR